MQALTEDLLKKFREDYEKDSHARTMTAAAAQTDIEDLAYLPAEAAKLNGAFSIEVKTRGITAQEKSGRCWAYASLNILREILAEKLHVDEFRLSGNYMAFYDKLEKANNMLEMAIEYADRPLDSHIMDYLLYPGLGDGGHFDMARDLVRKYGICPADAMPESYTSSHTANFLKKFNTLIRKDIAELRTMMADGGVSGQRSEAVRKRKEEMMSELYKVECIVFGQPPEHIDITYRDTDGEYHALRNLTPLKLYREYADGALEDLVSVVSEDAGEKKTGHHYFFHYKGSMAEGSVDFINLDFQELEALCISQLKSGKPVWFGCDCLAYENRAKGVWDQESFDYDGILGDVKLEFNKKERLEYQDSYANHAMILVGVDLDEEGRPTRWKIENSWGEEAGRKGYFVCSEHWFREYVYEAIIDKAMLDEKQTALLESRPEELAPWTAI